MQVRLEYGHDGLDVELPDNHVLRSLTYKQAKPLADPAADLDSLLQQPIGTASLAELAANYLFWIVKNHAFVDGNKRTAWVIARTFLALNGVSLDFDALEAITFVESVAAGAVDRAEATIWFVERIA